MSLDSTSHMTKRMTSRSSASFRGRVAIVSNGRYGARPKWRQKACHALTPVDVAPPFISRVAASSACSIPLSSPRSSSCFSASSGCELGSREASNEYLNGSPSSSRYCEPIASRAAGSLIESAANARLGAISSFTKTRWPPSSSTKSPGGTAIASAKRTLIRRSFGSASTAPPALVRSEAVSSSRYALPIGAASALGASASPGSSTATAVNGAPPTNGSQTAPCPAPPALPPRRALSGSATRPAPAALVASSTRQRGGSGSGALRFPGQCGARAGAWLDGSGTGVVLSRLASQPGIAA